MNKPYKCYFCGPHIDDFHYLECPRIREVAAENRKEGGRGNAQQVSVYRGDDMIASGRLDKVAKQLGVQAETIRFYLTPAYARRIAKRRFTGGNIIQVVRI